MKTIKNSLIYFENRSMRSLYEDMTEWQSTNGRCLSFISIHKDGDTFCCIACGYPAEVVITDETGRNYVEVQYNRLKVSEVL
jgi:hypothetical protein